MKLVTWNVNSLKVRLPRVLEFLKLHSPDVACLQETKVAGDAFPEAELREAGYAAVHHSAGHWAGVALLVRHGLTATEPAYGLPGEIAEDEARWVEATVDGLRIASVYVPNGGKDYAAKLNFLTRLAAWSRQLHDEGREVVLCGDINIARFDIDVHPKERRADVVGQRAEERELFESLLGGRLVDVGRTFAPDNPGLFTWWPPWRNMRQRNIGWRIDYILASSTLAERATSCVVLADVGTSDHAPVMMTVA